MEWHFVVSPKQGPDYAQENCARGWSSGIERRGLPLPPAQFSCA